MVLRPMPAPLDVREEYCWSSSKVLRRLGLEMRGESVLRLLAAAFMSA